jgi:hypothetical protein
MHKCDDSLPYRSYQRCSLHHESGAGSLEKFLLYFNALRLSQTSKRLDKPVSLDLKREYFRTNVRTLFVCFVASIENPISPRRKWGYFEDGESKEFRFGQSFFGLTRKGNALEAQINVSCSECATVNQRTKHEYEQILPVFAK